MAADLPLVLFTGSRNWPNFERVGFIMRKLWSIHGPYKALHGGARGLDTFVDHWVRRFGWLQHAIRPQYDLLPPWEAPKARNTVMLAMKPVLVVAFWREGSTTGGTLDCIDKAVNTFRIPTLIYRR